MADVYGCSLLDTEEDVAEVICIGGGTSRVTDVAEPAVRL
jgi:hypothetical protein